jgi:hypothetical protein
MRGDLDGNSSRNQLLAMADRGLRLYDRPGLRGGLDSLSDKQPHVRLRLWVTDMNWELITVICVVVVCAGLLVRRTWRWLQGSGQSSCSSCPGKATSNQAIRVKQLTQLKPPQKN